MNAAQPPVFMVASSLGQSHPLRARQRQHSFAVPFLTCSPCTMSFMTEGEFRYDLLWGSLRKNGRRKSLKTLFQLPLSARTSNYGTLSTTASVGSLPADIVREIVDLMSPSDILSFSLTVRYLLSSFMPDIEILVDAVKASAGPPPSSSV